MDTKPTKIIFTIVGIIILIGIIIFSYFKYKPMIEGPLLSDISLEPWNNTGQSSVTIEGQVKNTQNIMINGRSLVLDESNQFREIVGLHQGSNQIFVDLVDIFGKEKSYIYNVYADYLVPEFAETYQQALEQQKLEENPPEPETTAIKLIETTL